MNMQPPTPWSAPPTTWPAPPSLMPRGRLGVALAAVGALLGAAGLVVGVVALQRISAVPSYSAAQQAAALTELCDRFKPAMDALHIETNRTDAGLARTSLINGALILDRLASNPALDPIHRDTAKAVAQSYEDLVVDSSFGRMGEPRFDAALSAVISKEDVLKELCRY